MRSKMSNNDDILSRICAVKSAHVTDQKQIMSENELKKRIADMPACRGFVKKLQDQKNKGAFGLICEVKKASPSKGVIRADFDPVHIAKNYEKGKADCLSVLTDTPFFQGHDDYLQQIKQSVSLPLLRKDFMIDPYQIYESRALGADCILLILACLDHQQALDLESQAIDIGLDVLIETHDEHEMQRALKMQSPLIGINNRNLKDFSVSLDISKNLCQLASQDKLLVSESGIYTYDDLCDLKQYGINIFLIGESLMRQENITQATEILRYGK